MANKKKKTKNISQMSPSEAYAEFQRQSKPNALQALGSSMAGFSAPFLGQRWSNPYAQDPKNMLEMWKYGRTEDLKMKELYNEYLTEQSAWGEGETMTYKDWTDQFNSIDESFSDEDIEALTKELNPKGKKSKKETTASLSKDFGVPVYEGAYMPGPGGSSQAAPQLGPREKFLQSIGLYDQGRDARLAQQGGQFSNTGMGLGFKGIMNPRTAFQAYMRAAQNRGR